MTRTNLHGDDDDDDDDHEAEQGQLGQKRGSSNIRTKRGQGHQGRRREAEEEEAGEEEEEERLTFKTDVS